MVGGRSCRRNGTSVSAFEVIYSLLVSNNTRITLNYASPPPPVIFGCLAFGAFWFVITMADDERRPAPSAQEVAKWQADAAKAVEIKQLIENGVASGTFHSVDFQKRRLRISPAQWAAMKNEEKRKTILTFFQYYELRHYSTSVKVLSDTSDEVLAECKASGYVMINR